MANFTIPEFTVDEKITVLRLIQINDQQTVIRFIFDLLLTKNDQCGQETLMVYAEGVYAGLLVSHKIHMWLLNSTQEQNDKMEERVLNAQY